MGRSFAIRLVVVLAALSAIPESVFTRDHEAFHRILSAKTGNDFEEDALKHRQDNVRQHASIVKPLVNSFQRILKMVDWLKTKASLQPVKPVKPTVKPVKGSCGRPAVPHSRIVGGKDARLGAWPWQVALYINATPKGTFRCGGSLVAPRWVVTAAHCILTRFRYTAVFGDRDRMRDEGTEQTRHAKNIIVHPSFIRRTLENDVALIYLDRPVIYDAYVKPVCLPGPFDMVPVGTNCYTTGWGKIKHPGNAHTILQQARLPVVDQAVCSRKLESGPLGRRMNVTSSMVCGGEKDSITSSCHGDSGGPYVCPDPHGRWVLQGVVSWGSLRCNTRDAYTVFARLSYFRNWLNNHMHE